jgi:hypothetical protein
VEEYHQKLILLFEYQQPAKLALAVVKPVGLDAQDVPSYSSVAAVYPHQVLHQMLNQQFVFHNLLKHPCCI